MKFHYFYAIYFGMIMMVVYGCSDTEYSQVTAPIIDASNRPPINDFISNYPFFYQKEIAQFSSTSWDPEGQQLNENWYIAGSNFEGRTVTYAYNTPGEYRVLHTVDDGVTRVERSKTIFVKPSPRVIIRLVNIHFEGNVGDDFNDNGDIYIISNIIVTRPSTSPNLIGNILPGDADKIATWKVEPYSDLNFGANSGIILYEGIVSDLLGVSIMVIDHDSQFNWGSFIGDIFEGVGAIVGVLEPKAGAVLGGLGQLSDLIGSAVQNNGDDVVAPLSELHTPNNRWGMGQSHIKGFANGVIITYSIEVIP